MFLFHFPDIPISTNAPVNVDEWPSAVAPILVNGNRSLPTLPGVTGLVLCLSQNLLSFSRCSFLRHFDRVAHESHHQIALGGTPPPPLASSDYSIDALLKPSCFAVETEAARAYASQTAWYKGGVTVTQLDRSQVPPEPTGLGTFGKSWPRHDNACQAVPALSQASLHDAGYPAHPVPAGLYTTTSPEVSACITSQSHMPGFGSVSSRTAGAAPGYLASPPYRRQPRPERVVCDKCKKSMRRQSLKRHIREVHNHVRRPHAKSGFPVGP